MILIKTFLINDKTQDIQKNYNDSIKNCFHVMNLKCPHCGCKDHYSHGFYNRHFVTNHKAISIELIRIKCTLCNKTHTLMTYDLIPYCYMDASTAKKILEGIGCKFSNEYIEEAFFNNLKRRRNILKRHYFHNYNIQLDITAIQAIDEILLANERHLFLQIHRGNVFPNINST